MKKLIVIIGIISVFVAFPSYLIAGADPIADPQRNQLREHRIDKWYGGNGYIRLKDGKLHTPNGLYYPSGTSGNKWHGAGGYIRLKNGKLHTPFGLYYPSQ